MEVNIVQLIEKNPITRLTSDYQNKFLNRIKQNFFDDEQKMFVGSFYCYLNYNSKNDFVVDFDSVWKWLGFSRKSNCKTLLEKYFIENIDYKVSQEHTKDSFAAAAAKPLDIGGRPTNKILLTINAFKKLCLKSNTKKADEIHNYYVKLEEMLLDITEEESKELKLQVLQKDHLLFESILEKEQLRIQSELEKERLLEETLLSQFPDNTQCVYYGLVDNQDTDKCNLIKFGISNKLKHRIAQHKKTYTNFRLKNVFKVNNHIEIENCIKQHPVLKKRIRSIMIENINYRELICIDPKPKDPDFSLEKLDEYIKEIIEENQYNIENYNKLLVKNANLESELRHANDKIEQLTQERDHLKQIVDKFTPKDDKVFKSVNSISSHGHVLFAYDTGNNTRYKVGMCKNLSLDSRIKTFGCSHENGKLELQSQLKHPFLEKTLLYLLKRHLLFLGNDTYDGTLADIKIIFDIILRLEDIIINNDIDSINRILNNQKIVKEPRDIDPETPQVKKAKRSVDQIDKETGKIINTFPSLEAAGRANGITGTAVGIAVRNKNLCQGYIFRYSNISKEDQMRDQPVIKINCKTGERRSFLNITEAARDANISAPGLRNRILTDVHSNNFHWVFDETATHYS